MRLFLREDSWIEQPCCQSPQTSTFDSICESIGWYTKAKEDFLPMPRSLHGTGFCLTVECITSILYDEGIENSNDEQYDRLQRELRTTDLLINKSNQPNDAREATSESIESITNAFLHLAKLVGDRHCNQIIDVLLDNPIESVRFLKSVQNVQSMRTNKSKQMEEKRSGMAS